MTAAGLAGALHVSNGDATDLLGTGLAARVLFWRDVLHEGPVPAVGPDELRPIRAGFLARGEADDRAATLRWLAERDRALEANREGEYVLWFDADLYDQLQIVQILARLAELGVPAARITLICIGEHPGTARFGGLGELTAAQLREVAGTGARAVLTPEALELATRAWSAFRAPAPDGLRAMAAVRSAELRFLGEAFDRLGREYPWLRDGLSLTERRLLAAADAGARDAGTAFVQAGARETRPFLGDVWAFATLRRLATARVPLLDVDPVGPPVARRTRVRLTEAGARVLSGLDDHVALNGVHRWIGGVRLHGTQVPWRWDGARETIVSRRR